MKLTNVFPMLGSVLEQDQYSGISIRGRHLIPTANQPVKQIPLLRHYMVDDSVQEIIQHNLRWANNQEEKPRFKFVYVMLPTSCNQRCKGCFTGKDKSRLPSELNGDTYSSKTIEDMLGFLKEHSVEAVVYGGGGELFTWRNAFDYIDQITNSGLEMIIFTNGTLLSKDDVKRLSKRNISLIISLKDTLETEHNRIVQSKNGFKRTLSAIEYALETGMHRENRLAVEMPVTRENENRVLYDFIPAMRSLGLIPFPEEYIQIMTSPDEKRISHTFEEARKFFKKAAEIDERFGYSHPLVFGQRMLAQPKCERPLYAFAIYPNGDLVDCSCHSVRYGNFYNTSLRDVIYSDRFKSELKRFQLCPCSVFYTSNDVELGGMNLPKYLEVFKCQK